MVNLTLLELHFPDARFVAEAEFNAPFAGRGSNETDDGSAETADSATSGPPTVAPLLVAGLLAVVALTWLRRRNRL